MESYVAAQSFAAISQPTRLETLRRLIAVGGGGMPAGDLAAAAGVSAPNMSFHLKELQRAGLIAASRDGREIRYRADFGGIRALVEYLMADCCNGDPRLCGPYVIAAPRGDVA